MNAPDVGIHNLAIEVSNFKTKNFRNEYENPTNRLKTMILEN